MSDTLLHVAASQRSHTFALATIVEGLNACFQSTTISLILMKLATSVTLSHTESHWVTLSHSELQWVTLNQVGSGPGLRLSCYQGLGMCPPRPSLGFRHARLWDKSRQVETNRYSQFKKKLNKVAKRQQNKAIKRYNKVRQRQKLGGWKTFCAYPFQVLHTCFTLRSQRCHNPSGKDSKEQMGNDWRFILLAALNIISKFPTNNTWATTVRENQITKDIGKLDSHVNRSLPRFLRPLRAWM